MRKKKFSIPYDASDIDNFLKELDKRKEYVHDVFVALPGVDNYFTPETQSISKNYDLVCHNFLLRTRGMFPRFVPLNADYSDLYLDDMKETFLPVVIRLLKQYEIDGVICSNFYMAKQIKEEIPSIRIDTSCNCGHWSIAVMKGWQKEVDVEAFNVPREAGRNYPFLKQVHDQGIPIKLLLNERCSPFCPYLAGFCMSHHRWDPGCYMDDREDCRHTICNTIVFPRWLDKLDSIVDVYKITGRYMPPDYIFRVLDLYIKGENCKLSDLIMFQKPGEFDIDTSAFDDRMLYCGFKGCGVTCNYCAEADKKLPVNNDPNWYHHTHTA